jgi:polygalacturonase
VAAAGGGEVLVPAPGVFKTLPVNLSSHTRLRVEGTMFALATDAAAWPVVPPVFTYATTMPTWRYQPFVWYPGVEAGVNISIAGAGESECVRCVRAHMIGHSPCSSQSHLC